MEIQKKFSVSVPEIFLNATLFSEEERRYARVENEREKEKRKDRRGWLYGLTDYFTEQSILFILAEINFFIFGRIKRNIAFWANTTVKPFIICYCIVPSLPFSGTLWVIIIHAP